MKTLKISAIILSSFLISCGSNSTESTNESAETTEVVTKNESSSLVEKRILQKLDVDALGTVEKFNIESIDKKDEATYIATYNFHNVVMNKETRLIREFHFTPDLDSITGSETIKSQMKSQGEWVDW